VVDCLSSKCEALFQTPVPPKKKKKKEREREKEREQRCLVFSQNRDVPQKCAQLNMLVTEEWKLGLELY
jgi:hypothetical protein